MAPYRNASVASASLIAEFIAGHIRPIPASQDGTTGLASMPSPQACNAPCWKNGWAMPPSQQPSSTPTLKAAKNG